MFLLVGRTTLVFVVFIRVSACWSHHITFHGFHSCFSMLVAPHDFHGFYSCFSVLIAPHDFRGFCLCFAYWLHHMYLVLWDLPLFLCGCTT